MTKEKKVKEPLLHVVKRENLPLWKSLVIYAAAIMFAIILVSLFCAASSKDVNNPFEMFGSLFNGVFGTGRRIYLFVRSTMMLIGVSLALLPAFKMKYWNLGANGQILFAALITFSIMNWGYGENISRAIVVPMMIVFSILAGVVWAVIPAIFKAFFRTNETLFTLMMNYIALYLVTVMITVWAPTGSGSLSPIDEYGMPTIAIGEQGFDILPIIIIAILAVVTYFYLTKSKHGYELSLVGESENTARYAGINVKRVAIRTLVLSGAICGIVGLLLSGSINHNVSESTHNNMGFTAIMTVWLANFNPLATLGTCALITFISTGMGQVQQDFGFTNNAITNVALGLIYFFIIACFFFINYKVVFRKSGKKDGSNDKAQTKTAEGGKA